MEELQAPAAAPAHRGRVVTIRTSETFQVISTRRVSVLPSSYASVHLADIIIVHDLHTMERCETWDVAALWIYAVGLGKTVVHDHDWQGIAQGRDRKL